MSVSSPGAFGARPRAYSDQPRVESTMMFSYTYNPSEAGKEVEIRPVNGQWTAIFPFSVPVSFVKTKSTNTVLMLSAHVLLRPTDQIVPVSAPVDDQYNLECFSMVNLLEGLSDEVENNSEHGAKFKMTQVDVDVTHAVVTSLDTAELTKVPLNLGLGNVMRMYLFRSESPLYMLTCQSFGLFDHARQAASNISLLDNPEWDADNSALSHGAFGPHNRHSSENPSQEASSRDVQRQVTIVLQGIPEVDGVQGQTIQSRWNCFFDMADLPKRDHTGPSVDVMSSSSPMPKHLYAPQPSHPFSLLPPQHALPGTPSNAQQLYKNLSMPSSPQPPQPLQRNTSVARRVSTSSPPVFNNRHSAGANSSTDYRAGRPSAVEGTSGQQRGGASSSAGRKSGLGGLGYGRSGNELAPVQEGSVHHSPIIGHVVVEGEADIYDEDRPRTGASNHGGRLAMNGGVSPGLGLALATQALNGVMHGRPEHDTGDGIVVSFAVTDRVVVGKIFNLEIFIVNRSHHVRRYTLVVPNRKRTKGSDPSQGSKVLPPLPSGERALVQSIPIDPYMEETELLRRHVDNETTEADIICLENNVRLSPLYPLTCQNLNLRFIAIKEQLHTIDLVQLVDNDTGFITNLRNCLCFMAEASFGALSQQVPEVRK
ncbi:hypothetical protein BGZ65_000876 [Modicella reniformis]|uniref:Trafficking protein particle complex II-specific subunit 65 IgD3 domain-containing protein n=1 Tax=Modicella reniformis TaxID=1440133 RepID=A0A9P6MA65_9FUNG|nr:hypothetical protein BGZ65_000876 [Modicella reniformis]